MNELPFSIKQAIDRYEEVTVDGITLYPIRVKEQYEWLVARQAIEILQQSLPVAMLSKPLLQVYYELDFLPALRGESDKVTGLWGCAMLTLALSLRLGQGLPMEERMLQFNPIIQPDNPQRLVAVRTALNGGEKTIDITPVQFQRLRPIIAAQNGVKLESDEANPDLVKAERVIAEMNGANLRIDFNDKLAFVAGKLHKRKAELYEWAIKEVEDYDAVFTRELYFMVNGIGGAFGGFGKGGNPVPHPYYERVDKASAHMALRDFANGAGERAVANAGQQVT